MKYTLYYAHAKLKAVKEKDCEETQVTVHLSIVRWNLLKRNIQLQGEKKRGRSGLVFCIEQYKNKIRKGPCYICCVCNRLLYKRSVGISAKVNIRVKIFSVCSLHLMENSMFVKQSLNTDNFYQHLSATINRA